MYGGLLLAVIWLRLFGCGLARSHVNQSSTSDALAAAPSAVVLDRRLFSAAPPGGSRVFSRSFGAAQGFHCFRQSTCEPLQHPYCFGTKLSYTNTSLNLATGVTSQQQAHSELRDWEFVRFVPRCWNVLQPLLCAVYLPPCTDSRVEQPSLEMCKTARELCRFADALLKWPSFMECTESHFPSRCESKLVKVKYNLPGYCLPPLVSTNNSLAYFPGLEGCAEPCRGLVYTQQESRQLHRFLHVFGGLSFALTLLTVLTYVIDWHTFSKYVANRCIFFINLCLCVSILGFLVQFMDESRHTVVCHADGTRRGPGSDESSSPCTAVFALIYYPSIAAMCWFIMLAFSWHVTLKSFGQSRGVQERLDALMSYFHLICWSVPLVLSTAALATADVVDSDYMYGICFVGFKNMQYRIGFVLAPALVAAVVGGFFLVRCVVFLLKYGPGRHAKQLVIAASVARLAVCGLLVLVAVLASIGCHVVEYADLHRRTAQLTEHILCLANTTARYDYGRSTTDQCSVASKSPLAVLKAHSFCLFGVGILFSSWVWRRSTLRSWNKFYHRLVGRPERDDRWTGRRMGKHRVIAQAWTKRYDLARNRRISLSFRSTYSDPVGIFGGLGTESSASPSSSFLAAIPNLLVRRGALIGSTSSALGLSRRTSNGSLYSMYSRPHSRYSRHSRCSRRSGRLSLDSEMSDRRRHSLDSTRSLTDVERVAMLLGGRHSRTAPGPPGARRRGRRRALAEVRRGLRAGGRRSQRRHTAGSEVTLSRRSSTVSRASSSIKSQLAHALEFLSRPHRQPTTGRALMSAAAVADGGGGSIADGGGGRHRRHRAGSSSTAAAVEPEPAAAAGGHDNCSYVHTENDPLVASAAGEAEAVEAADIAPLDGRRSAGSSVRTASRQSRGHGSNVSSGSSILNLAQRLRGDVTEFTRPRRRVGADAAGSSTPTRVVEAAIELTKLPTRRCSGNQSAVSVAVQTANQQPAFSAQAPIGCEVTGQDGRGLTLRNNLHDEPPMDRLNNGRLSPYSKNARRMSVAADVEADDVADKVVNISMRSSSTRSSKSRTSALDDDPLPEVF